MIAMLSEKAWRFGVWLLLAGLVGGLQWTSGAYQADLSSHPDEAAHAVSALLVRDYIASGFPADPMPFAQRYYVHYPKVAIGHWPPVFHASMGAWMLIFGRSQTAMLVAQMLLGVAISIGIFEIARRACGAVSAFFGAAIFSSSSTAQIGASSIMTDLLLAAFVLAATAAWGLFLESGRRKYAVAFAILAALSVGTHGRGVVVLLVPILAAWLQRSTRRRAWTIVAQAFLLIAVLCAPLLFQQTAAITPASVVTNFASYGIRWSVALSWLLPLLALAAMVEIARHRERSRWSALAGLLAANWIFFAVANTAPEQHYLLTALPSAAALGARGWHLLAAKFSHYRMGAVFAAASLAVLVFQLSTPHRKMDRGFAELADALPRRDRFTLIAAAPEAEGAFIAAAALDDPSLQRFVLRGSKMLAHSTWAGHGYRLLITDTAGIGEFLNRQRIGTVILQPDHPAPHVALLHAALHGNEDWASVPSAVAGIQVFQRTVEPPPGPVEIRIDNPGGFPTSFEVRE